MADHAAPTSFLPAKYTRVLKGFVLGVMVAALVLPRLGGGGNGKSLWEWREGSGGGGPGGGGEWGADTSSSDTNLNFAPKCPVTYYASLNDSHIAGRAAGCPPLPALCRLGDVFDEIVVLTLPRRIRQFSRLERQLAALGERYTVVHGFDIKTRVFQSMWETFKYGKGNGYDTVGEFAVGVGWLSVLEHIVATGAERALVLEDDVVFHINFPEEFDRRIRAIPKDFGIFYLGSTQFQLWNADMVEWPQAEVPEYYMPIYTWGAFAVGFNKEMALSMLETQGKLECRIDICTLPNELRRHRGKNKNFAAYPHIAIADVRYSDLRAGGNIENFAKECRWNLGMFDLDNGYVGGGGGKDWTRSSDSGTGGGGATKTTNSSSLRQRRLGGVHSEYNTNMETREVNLRISPYTEMGEDVLVF